MRRADHARTRRSGSHELKALGLSERTALKLVGISASVLRYQPRDDGNSKLRERLKELAGQHRRQATACWTTG